jgi:hypothetical protein
MKLDNVSTKALIRELKIRKVLPNTCSTCGKWSVTYKHYQGWGKAWHCDGCNKRVENCTCRR